MAVVSRPLDNARRAKLRGRVQRVLSSWGMTVVAYALLLLLGYLLLTPVVTWGRQRIDDLRYGYPRTTRVAGLVGHDEVGGEPTQLFALNLNGQVSVLELPGGDAGKVRALQGPYLVGADGPYAVPFLSLEDVTGDGQADLLLEVRNEVVVYINENGSFRLIMPAERAQLAPQEAQGNE